ncbi:MAG: response regulator [Pseudomonadota bacterium]
MHFHAIDDNAADRLLFEHLLNGGNKITVDTSKDLTDFETSGAANDTDFVLVDVHRPDAQSLRSDIDRLRRVTSAPIAFITGGEVGILREEALSAGADGLFEKRTITPEMLEQMCVNFQSRRAIEEAAALNRFEELALNQVGALAVILEEALSHQLDLADTRRHQIPSSLLRVPTAITKTLSAGALSSNEINQFIPATDLLVLFDEQVRDAALARKISIKLGARWRSVSEAGACVLQSSAIQCLTLGLIEECHPKSTIAIKDLGSEIEIIAPAPAGRSVRDLGRFADTVGISIEAAFYLGVAARLFDRSHSEMRFCSTTETFRCIVQNRAH